VQFARTAPVALAAGNTPSLPASPAAQAQERWRALGVDLFVAVATAGIDIYGSWDEAHSPVQGDPTLKLPPVPGWAYALVVGAGLALVGRRRWPLGSFAVALSLTAAYTALGYDDGAPVLAVAVSLYALATLTGPRVAWGATVAAGVLLVALEAALGPFGVTQGPVTVIPFELVAGTGSGFAVANRRSRLAQARERAEAAEKAKEEEARRQVELERLRIARELHDVVAHSMATVNVQAGVALYLLRERPGELAQAMAAMEAVRQTSKEALRELRGILNLLRSTDEAEPTAPVPRLSQLGDLVEVTQNAGLPTKLVVEGEPKELPPSLDLAVYRVVQESLTNALRHAGPAEAVVTLSYRPEGLVVEVKDNGKGAAGGAGGNGLVGMRERVEALGGALVAGPADAGGFRVRAELPYAGPPLSVSVAGP
jgi:signal transduction histidine kinase